MKSILLLSFLSLVSFSLEAAAWSIINGLSSSALRPQIKTVSPHPITRSSSSSPSSTQMRLKFIETSEEDNLPKLTLSPEEDDAIRAVSKSLSSDDAYGVGWFDRPEAWAAAKEEYPFLQQYDDEDLRDAYLKQKPKILDIFTGTPLGPFLLINLIVKFSGYSWCDTPFGQADSCIPK